MYEVDMSDWPRLHDAVDIMYQVNESRMIVLQSMLNYKKNSYSSKVLLPVM